MKYESPPKYEVKEVNRLLKSNNDTDKIKGLLATVLNSGDYNLSMKQTMIFTNCESQWLKICGIQCIGHIARIHKKIDLKSVKELLTISLKDENRLIVGNSEDAIDDVIHFLKLNKVEFEQELYVGSNY